MNLVVNSSAKAAEKAKEASSKVTGLLPYKVLAVNPSHEWLIKNFNPNAKPPVYEVTKKDSGNNSFRLDFYVQFNVELKVGEETVNKKAINKHSIWVEDGLKKTKAGDTYTISKTGSTIVTSAIAKGKEEGKAWVDKYDGGREMYIGEDQLTDFIRAYACMKSDQEYLLSDFLAITKGNIKEVVAAIKMIQTAEPNQELYILTGINEKGYYELYTNKYWSASNASLKRVQTFVEKDDYTAFKKAQVYTYVPTLQSETVTPNVEKQVAEAKEAASVDADGEEWY